MQWAKERWNAWRTEARERSRERKAERLAAKEAAAVGGDAGHPAWWLLSVLFFAVIFAAVVEWLWALLFCIEATGHIDWNLDTAAGNNGDPSVFLWNFAFSAHWPVFIGLVAATIPIVAWSMIWLPIVMMAQHVGRWRKGTMIAAGLLCNTLVIVSGTVVMNYNRQQQVREALVVEETAQQGRAAIQARLGFEQEQLRLALANTNPYLNQAANVGAVEWERSYVAQARATNDPRLPMLERALGAARAADQRRANIERLTVELAQAPTESAVAANVEDRQGAGMNAFAQQVEVWRPPFLAVTCTLIGIFGAWWLVGVYDRVRDRKASAPENPFFDPARAVEDLRDEPRVRGKPAVMKERMFDAETGDELIEVRGHRRIKRAGKNKRFAEVEIPLESVPPDERGVQLESDLRAARSTDRAEEHADNDAEAEPQDHASAEQQPFIASHDLSPEEQPQAEPEAGADVEGQQYSGESHDDLLTDEELAALSDEGEPVDYGEQHERADNAGEEAEGVERHVTALPDGEGVAVGDAYVNHEPAVERRPERLLEAAK